MTPAFDLRKAIVVGTIMLIVTSIAILSLPSIIAKRQDMATSNPPKRQDSEYIRIITEKYPDMLDSSKQPIFSIVSSEKLDGSWYKVTIENNANEDQLYTLVYDAKYGPQGMSLVLPPSIFFTHRENLTSIFIPDKIIRKMNCAKEGC